MQGAIFDMDGTILESTNVWYEVTETFFNNRKLVLEDVLSKDVQEMTLEESCSYMKYKFNLTETVEELIKEFQGLVSHEYMHNIPLKPFAKQYLERIHQDGVKLAIATSGFGNLCELALTRCGVWHLFDGLALSSEVKVNKSNPDVYLLAAERIGVKAERCTVYEDILSGIIGAKKAGMRAVGIYDKQTARMMEDMKKHADHYIMSWEELL